MSKIVRVENATRRTVLSERCEVADNPWTRLRGLLGRTGLEHGGGLLIRPCQGVHMWFMKFPIDVVYVDGKGRVCCLLEGMQPNQVGPMVWRSKHVVELPTGTIKRARTELGDEIVSLEPNDPERPGTLAARAS